MRRSTSTPTAIIALGINGGAYGASRSSAAASSRSVRARSRPGWRSALHKAQVFRLIVRQAGAAGDLSSLTSQFVLLTPDDQHRLGDLGL